MTPSKNLREEFEEKFAKRFDLVSRWDLDTSNDILSFISHREALAREKIQKLSDALIGMYEQYCRDGHHFMSAGERASSVLEEYGYADFDAGGRMTLTPSNHNEN